MADSNVSYYGGIPRKTGEATFSNQDISNFLFMSPEERARVAKQNQGITDWFTGKNSNTTTGGKLFGVNSSNQVVANKPVSGAMPMFSDMGSVVTPQATPSMFGGNLTQQGMAQAGAGVQHLLSLPQSATSQYMEQTPAWNNMVDTTGQFPQQVIPQAAQQQVIQQPSSPAAIQAQPQAAVSSIDPNILSGYQQYGDALSYAGVNDLGGTGQTIPTGTSMWDDITKSLGLDDMTTKDIYSGIGAGLQMGLGAYGMFQGLDQMDTRLDQGQQALDLNREEYDENLRHRRAIVAQNKGA